LSWLTPIVLAGEHAHLEPLSPTHHDALVDAVCDGELWNLWYTFIPRPEGMAAEIERRLELQEEGSMLPFTVFNAAGDVVGLTSFMAADPVNRRVEIGSTWYAARAQRTAVNTQCKLLMLGHAFDLLDTIAVEFRTHFLNQQSRRGIERLGARLDGILRSHQISPNGALRDTAVYSIVASEWPMVRALLTHRLTQPG
jgi:RimJ/RimL family protein N-acetyltransferase